MRNRVRNNCVTIRERHKRLLINQGEARSRPRGGGEGVFRNMFNVRRVEEEEVDFNIDVRRESGYV